MFGFVGQTCIYLLIRAGASKFRKKAGGLTEFRGSHWLATENVEAKLPCSNSL